MSAEGVRNGGDTHMNQPISVLLIDDNPIDREVHRRFLEQSSTDYVVHEAEDGASGIDAAARLQPDCVVLDLKLSDQSGFEVLIRLVGEEPSPKMPVIMLTTSVSNLLADGALSFGAQHYLIKGRFQPDQLDQAIKEAIAQCKKTQELRSESHSRSFGATEPPPDQPV
jgi:DNA-binding NarL/FixJ family response regulator